MACSLAALATKAVTNQHKDARMQTDSESWTNAKSHGDAGEQSLARFFRQRGFDVAKQVEPATEYDLMVQGRIEVKHDLAAPRTGNVAVEVSYKGEPSGIMSTTATMWCFIVDSEALLMPTDRFRVFVMKARPFVECDAGDGKLARVKLIPVDLLRLQKFVRIVPVINNGTAAVSPTQPGRVGQTGF